MDFLSALRKSMEVNKKTKRQGFNETWAIKPTLNTPFIYYKTENEVIPFNVDDMLKDDWIIED